MIRSLDVSNRMTTLCQFNLTKKLTVPQARQFHFFALVVRSDDLHFTRLDHEEMLDRFALPENRCSRSNFSFLGLFRCCQHLWVREERQGSRHCLVNDLAIRDDDRLICSL